VDVILLIYFSVIKLFKIFSRFLLHSSGAQRELSHRRTVRDGEQKEEDEEEKEDGVLET
jgi:hypothetical protein